jgi:hypothetical protein
LGQKVAQVLLTEEDFSNWGRYSNLRRTMEKLLGFGVLPIVNENDTVSTAELESVSGARQAAFSDNDRLAALVMSGMEADALVLLRHLEQIIRLEDFSTTEVTLTGNPDEDMTAPTVAATARVPSSGPHAAGPATLMQSLIRAELEGPERGLVSAFFNNTYALIAMLALLIIGGVWWFQHHEPTAEERFNRAAALLENDAGPDWLRARDELQALVAEDGAAWSQPAKLLLEKIELYELTRPARGGRGPKGEGPKSEGKRLVQLALHYRQIGDLPRAERTLSALQTLLAGDEQQVKLRDLTEKLLEEIRGELARVDDRDRLLEGAFERAEVVVDELRQLGTATARAPWSCAWS